MERLQAIDLGMLYFMVSLRRPWLTPVVLALTHLGDFQVMIGVVLAAVGGFLVLRQPRLAGVLLSVAVLSLCVEWTAKDLVQRPRPSHMQHLVPLPDESSFPSGHALRSMAIYGCIGLLLSRLTRPRWGRLLIAAGIGLGLVIGLTRLYLAVHYPLDVLAGWTAGLACALLGSVLAGPPQPAVTAAPA